MTVAPRIVTVTLNASIDHTVRKPNFTAGAVNRVVWEQSDAGGKGVNVASFLADVGHAIAVTGLLGADNQESFLRLFAEKRLVDRFVRVRGQTRVNVKVVDDVLQQVTDINFPGVAACPGDVETVQSEIDVLADQGVDVFVVSGSLPTGVRPDVYRDVAARLKARGCKVLVDTSGEPLALAIQAAPDVIRPNIGELTELIGRSFEDERAVVGAARDLCRRGIGLVSVSMGSRGAIFVDATQAVHAAPPAVDVKSTVGAGDAMVAGIVHGILGGLGLEDGARLATSFSLGALGVIGPRLPSREVLEAFEARVVTRPIAA